MPTELPVAESALAVLATIAAISVSAAWIAHVYIPANVRKWNHLTMELSDRLATLENDRQRDHAEMQRLRIRLTELEIGVTNFASAKSADDGDTLEVTYTVTMSNV